jgi:hypothetical protein
MIGSATIGERFVLLEPTPYKFHTNRILFRNQDG